MRVRFAKALCASLGLLPLLLAACLGGEEPRRYAAPRLDAWRILGPGGGGAQFYPAVSPHDPNLVLVACDMTGAYISEDGGNSWRMFNLRSPVTFFVFDPSDPKVIYAGAHALWRSADRGRTWSLIYPSPSSVTRLIMPDDHASPIVLTKGGPAEPVTALAVDPGNSRTLFAAAGRGREAALYASTDWGGHWERTGGLGTGLDAGRTMSAGGLPLDGVRKIYIDSHSPSADRTLYLIGRNSVSIRKAGRWSRHEAPEVAEFRDVSAGFTSGGELIVYAVAVVKEAGEHGKPPGRSTILISRNGGVTWGEATSGFLDSARQGPPRVHFLAVSTSLSHPEVAYVSYEGLTIRNQSGEFHGVARTGDAGSAWELVWKEEDRAAANVHDAWITERFGAGWGGTPYSLGVAPFHPEICYATDDGRTMRTTDGGRTWEAVYCKRLPDGTDTTSGLDVTTNYGVFLDPFDARRIFIAYTDIGLFRSENRGESWTSATLGVPRQWVNTTYWIAFDPAVKGRVWGAMSYVHDLPRPKMWRHTRPSAYAGGVCISEDGGRTWRPSNQGMPPAAVTHILLDPGSPVEARVLYATGFGRGVFKSVDGGKTWDLKNNGLPGPEPFAWRLARDRRGTLYLVVARRSEDGSFGNAEDGAIYRSSDGAEHWERVQLPKGVNGPNGVAIDPDDPSRLYLAAWGRETPNGAVDGGIFVTVDGGATWRSVLSQDQHVYDVTIDPRDARMLYACGFESSAWHSADRGETWTRIRGYNFKWGHRVIPDPQDPAMIYITTFGGSVWYGPASGDSHATEDIVTSVLAYEK